MENLIGEWLVVKAEGMMATSNKGMLYKFEDEKNVKLCSGLAELEYGYSFQNDILSFNLGGKGDFILEFTYKIEGDKMVLDNASDAIQMLWLEKK